MISVFADERQYSDNAEERAEARTAIAHELAEIQRAEDKLTAIFTEKKTDPEEEPATDQMQ